MIADFGASDLGLTDPYAEKKEDTENRSIGTLLKDEAARAAAPVVGWARSATNTARAVEEGLREGPATIMGPVDRGVAQVQHWLEEAPSARSKALDQNKWFPKYGERSAWDEPVTTLLHGVAPLAPYLAATKGAGAFGAAGRIGTTAAMGGIGAGEAANKVRDYADSTPLEELRKLPAFNSIYMEFNGNEQAARTALFRRSVDLVSELTNAGANMLSFGFLQHALAGSGMVQKPLAALLGRIVLGGTEGAVSGAALGGAGEYASQRLNVDLGKQQAIDTGAVLRSSAETSAAMAPLIAGLHAVRSEPKDTKPSAIPKGGLDPGIKKAADDALNEGTPATPESLPGAPPTPPAGSVGAPAGAAPPVGGAPGVTPPGAPPGAPPAGPGAAPGAPPTAAGPPGTPPTAMASGAPPVQAQQPAITANPPRTRTPPVTPAPTPPTTSPAGAPAAAARPADVTTVEGRTVSLVGNPTLRNGVMLQRVLYEDGTKGIVRAGDVTYTPATAPTPGVTPAAPPAGGGLETVKKVRAKKEAAAAPPTEAAPADAPVADWQRQNNAAAVELATKLGVTDQIREMATTGQKTAKQISQALGGRLDENEVRAVRDSLGIKPLGPSVAFGVPIPEGDTVAGPTGVLGFVTPKTPANLGAAEAGLKPKKASGEVMPTRTVAEIMADQQKQTAAATAPTTNEGIGKAIVEAVQQKAPKPTKAAPIAAVRGRQAIARAEGKDLPEGELKSALTAVWHKQSDFDDLQRAADYGRANNRADITGLATDLAETMAREAAKAAKAQVPYPETHRNYAQAKAQLSSNAAAARRRAEDVRHGRRTEVPTQPPQQEGPPQDQATREAAGAEKKVPRNRQAPDQPSPA